MTDHHTSTGRTGSGNGNGVPPLRRSRGTKVIGGVCGGLGRTYDVDPVIFRVALAVTALASGVGFIAYAVAWLLIPREGEDENEGRRLLYGRVEGEALAAVLCAVAGCGLLLATLGHPTRLFFSVVVLGILAGCTHWLRRRQKPGTTDTAAGVDSGSRTATAGTGGTGKATTATAVTGQRGAPPETQAPPAPGGPSWWRDPITKDGTAGTTGTGYLWGPDDGLAWDAKEPTAAPAWGAGYRPARRHGPWIGGWVFLLAVAACATGLAATWDAEPLGTSLQTGLACALAVFGLGLVVSAFYGRAGGGTIVLAVLTAGLLAAAAALPKSVTADWARTEWRPATVSDVRPEYELGTGVGTLDLSKVVLDPHRTVSTRASVGAGQLKIIVPEDARVELDVEIGLGDLRLPGDRREDVDVTPGIDEHRTVPPAEGQKARGTLDLDLKTGVGQVVVSRGTP
ncbi:PspC domain-containing protein [Streptomyces sp. NPDC051776]|uniref:PspC domain-containing protein n=1 Tax=Streptomyces sp. NPDC051776 TaxID=3155414 RepID=UPI0034279AE9